MATRRTTMRSRTGTKLYAVRDSSGKFKDIQSYQRAHSADMRQTSQAETEAKRGPFEKKVRKAAKTVGSSVKGAVAAVKRAAKRVAKRVSTATSTPTSTKKAVKKVVKKAVKKASGKQAAKKS